MATLFEALRADHDEHRALMEKLAATSGDTPDRRGMIATLRAELESHAAAEERCLYAEMMKHPSSTDMARHGVAEHHDIDKLLAELAGRAFDDPHWLTTFRKLQERVEHHLDEEEHGVFQLAGKVMAEDDKTRLAETFRTEKARELERRGG